VNGLGLTLKAVAQVSRHGVPVMLSREGETRRLLEPSRSLVLEQIARGVPIYGVTTRFGDSAHRQVAPAKARALQRRLVDELRRRLDRRPRPLPG
jgi:histidine ammonia-lyase/phenylalanine ammonia-lyase